MSIHIDYTLLIKSSQPKRDKFAGLTRKAKRRKLALKEDAELGETGAIKAAIRGAKRETRPSKIGVPDRPRDAGKARAKEKKKGKKKAERVSKTGFDRELGVKRRPVAAGGREGARAKKGDAIGSGKKRGKK